MKRVQWGTALVLLFMLSGETRAAGLQPDCRLQIADCGLNPDANPPSNAGRNLPGGRDPQSLEDLIQEALARNPEVLAARRQFDAKAARVPQMSAPPEPMISVTSMGNLLPFSVQVGDPSSARIISFSQEIPFPGKLSLKSRSAAMEAEAERWNYEMTWRNVIASLKLAYYDLAFIDKSIETVNKTKDLLQQFLKIAEARYQVGRGIQQDVLKAQTEISMLIERLTMLEQKRGSAVAMINSLLDRSPETPLARTADVKKGELKYSLDDLYQMAATKYPGLKQQERVIDSSQYNVALAKKEFYPDFSVSFQYLQRPIMPEMWGLNVTLKVPLYFWKKQRPALEEAAAELAGAKQQHNSIKTQLFVRVKDQYLMATTAERLIRLYEEGIIPQATLTLESSVASYQVGAVDFLTLLTNVITVLTYELNYYEQLTIYQKSLAQLEPLVGVELAR